jgi:actin
MSQSGTSGANSLPSNHAIVVDCGSGMIKAGMNSDSNPKCIFPSVAGLTANVDIRTQNRRAYVGYDAWAKRHLLSEIMSPIDKGVITDFEMMDKIWQHTFKNELKVKTENYPVLLTEPPLNPLRNREIMTEMMFEKYKVPGLYLAISSVLALYECGRTTGLVVDSGDGSTDVCPIYEGYALPHGILQTDIAGRDLTKYLMKLLTDNEEKSKNDQICTYQFSETRHDDVLLIQEMKEKLCYCAVDYESEGSDSRENWKIGKEQYTLPDKSIVTLGKERIKCPEVMFKPTLIGYEPEGSLHETVIRSLQKCDSDITKELQANVIMTGGNTMFSHMDIRLKKELENLSAPTATINVDAPPERKHSVWIGGALLSSLNKFNRLWITKKQYEEFGSSYVHARCF